MIMFRGEIFTKRPQGVVFEGLDATPEQVARTRRQIKWIVVTFLVVVLGTLGGTWIHGGRWGPSAAELQEDRVQQIEGRTSDHAIEFGLLTVIKTNTIDGWPWQQVIVRDPVTTAVFSAWADPSKVFAEEDQVKIIHIEHMSSSTGVGSVDHLLWIE